MPKLTADEKLAMMSQHAQKSNGKKYNSSIHDMKMSLLRRYARDARMAGAAALTPWRVGSEVSDRGFMSADKRLSRSIENTYIYLWRRAYHSIEFRDLPVLSRLGLVPVDDFNTVKKQGAADPEIRSLGATVIWTDWWRALRPKLLVRQSGICTIAVRSNGLEDSEERVDLIDSAWIIYTLLHEEIENLSRGFDRYAACVKELKTPIVGKSTDDNEGRSPDVDDE